MKAEAKIVFDPVIDAIVSTISYGTAPNTEKPFGDFLIKANDHKSTPDLCKPDENLSTNLSESQKIIDDDLLAKEALKSNDVQKTDIHGNEEATNHLSNIKSGLNKIKKLSKGKISANRNIAGQSKPAAQSVLNDKPANELQKTVQNSIKSATVVNKNKNIKSAPANGLEVKQFSGKDVKSGRHEAVELNRGKISANRNIAGQFKPAAQSVLNDKPANELENSVQNSIKSATVINKNKNIKSAPANGLEVKQFSGKDVKSGRHETVELNRGKISADRNIAGQFKPAAQSVLNDKPVNELQKTVQNSIKSAT
ncbi:MAG: hypothetical protein J7L86_05695, partial [Candidatus Marinimicrobia bacterium]|nr:hypothetical protein [Candidatus Neomarinimicrobiota bacterium]